MAENVGVQLLPTEAARAAIETISQENRKFYSDRRGIGALRDLQQTFPNPWLYLAELLQNAVDEEATSVKVVVRDDGSMLFEHNGKSFSETDVNALCARGVSTKGANTIGFMGIGFKAVFRSYQSVQIASESWRFKLSVPVKQGEAYGDQQRDWLGAVLPFWDESGEAPSGAMKCRFVLSNRLPNLPPSHDDLRHVLGDSETLLALLAWAEIRELNWDGTVWLLARHENEQNQAGEQQVILEALDRDARNRRRWVLFSKGYQPSRQAIARFLEHRQLSPSADDQERVYSEASQRRKVAIFCEIDDSDAPIPLDRGSAFALLPTGVTFPLGLHVQADWLLVVSRREIMQIEGNQWHEEILEQLPRLIRCYLQWLVAHPSTSRWSRGYDALPSSPARDIATDQWFGTPNFLAKLKTEIENLPFLPRIHALNQIDSLLSPNEGRFLPKPLAKEFEDPQLHPSNLFTDRIVSSRLLGVKAKQCLERLKLNQELSPDALSTHWNSGVVGHWLVLFPGDSRSKVLLSLVQALVDLDDRDEWRRATLVCLPTASGSWAHRYSVSRYPADWNVLAQEDEIRRALEPFLDPPERMISWDFERTLQQTRSTARSYLDNVPAPKLEDVVDKWWELMPVSPSEGQLATIVHVSAWILEKQPQRKGLIKKLLCVDGKGNLCLRPNTETLLAEPYAGGFRRRFFQAIPTVAPVYETKSATANRSDWRAFFEKLEPSPVGRFFLTLTSESMSQSKLSNFVGGNYNPPSCRVTWMRGDWRSFKVESGCYTVVHARLPEAIVDLLKNGVTRDDASAIAQWLDESPTLLSEYSSMQFAYIPYNSSWVATQHAPKKAQWVDTLNNARWVYGRTGDGPFRPCDVLADSDPARPDAPVAELSSPLIAALQQSGVQFGTALPDAPAIERLRIQGPTAPPDELFDFLVSAVNEADDDEKKALLRSTLIERELFPFPPSRRGIDGSDRVSHGRLVRSDRPRSLLGDWLVSFESFPEDSAERKVLETLDAFLPVPKTADFLQVLEFLSWVWSTTPDADLVRRILPRAYAYINEDLDTDASLSDRWKQALSSGRVFVQGKRRWTGFAESDEIFFDDLNDPALGDLLSPLELATPGHLGETQADQIAIARLLGLRFVSTRFSVAVEAKGPQLVPAHWQSGFIAVQNWLRAQLKKEGDDASDEGDVLGKELKLSLWQTVRTVVYDFGKSVQVNDVRAALWKDGSIAVSCTPDDFAEELCKLLFNQWGLRLRRDLIDLIPGVAIQLTKIGDPAVVARWISEKQAEHASEQQPLAEQPNATVSSVMDDAGNYSPSESAPSTILDETPQEVEPQETVLEQAPLEEDSIEEEPSPEVVPAGSYTDDDHEARIKAWVDKKNDLERKINDALALGVFPKGESEQANTPAGEFRTDDPYRQAALKYEREHDRYPDEKDAKQPGHDIDSYTHSEGDPERRLVRRIEVKGKGTRWDSNEIVEMSDRQFGDALSLILANGEQVHPNFDYWLYVVERDENGGLHVLAIRNVARRAALFALRGDSWRHIAETDDSQTGVEEIEEAAGAE